MQRLKQAALAFLRDRQTWLDLTGLLGAGAFVRGVHDLSAPASWMVGGGAVVVFVWRMTPSRRGN